MSQDQEKLHALLAQPAHPEVRLIVSGNTVIIAAKAALLLVRSGQYHWWGSRHKVRKMRPIHTHRWQACYRTTRSATLQPSIEWLASVTLRLD